MCLLTALFQNNDFVIMLLDAVRTLDNYDFISCVVELILSNFMFILVFSLTRSSISFLSVRLLFFIPIKTEKPRDKTLIMIAVEISIVIIIYRLSFFWHTAHHPLVCAACYHITCISNTITHNLLKTDKIRFF